MGDPTDALARRAAAAAAKRPAFLAWALARFQAQEALDDDALARWLGLDPAHLPWLALCRRPRPDAFRADVATIAERFPLAPDRLASLLRQIDALAALQTMPSAETGLLAAARDRDEESPVPAPADEAADEGEDDTP